MQQRGQWQDAANASGWHRERGLTQAQLAERIGILQTLVTDYEHDRLRLSAEMAVRFTLALGVSLDAWLLPEAAAATLKKLPPSRAISRRMATFATLPRHQQRLILVTLDMLLVPFVRRLERKNREADR